MSSSGHTTPDQSPASTAKNSQSHVRRHALPRRSTIDPLNSSEDPLASEISPPETPPRHSLVPESKPLPATPARSRSPGPSITVVDQPKKDFGYLLRRDLFQVLNENSIPLPFRQSTFYPTQGLSIDDLLSKGRFRAAAAAAATQLTTQGDVTDHPTIFNLFFTRLACLQLAGLHDIAVQESKALQDLNTPFYIDQSTGKHIVPWELRVLAVRLQAMGFGDWRRGVMGYYELAREARSALRDPQTQNTSLWRERLTDLGVRVGNALLEMGDDEGAIRHLKTLEDADTPVAKTRLALVHLRAGDVRTARRCIRDDQDDGSDSTSSRLVEALCKMGDGAFNDAATEWRALQNSPDVGAEVAQIAAQNLAICLLFTGNIDQARGLLEDQVSRGAINRTATFNLATIYELCSDKSGAHKMGLAADVAAREPDSTGWDFASADFKL